MNKQKAKQIIVNHSLQDIVREAALMGVEYTKNFDSETAEGVIVCNPDSLVLKVLDRVERADPKLGGLH